MNKNKFLFGKFTVFPPAICMALGTAISFYLFKAFRAAQASGVFLSVSLLLLVAIISFAYTLLRLTNDVHAVKRGQSILILAICFSVGFALGIKDRAAAVRQTAIYPGQLTESVISVSGKLLSDPRTTNTNRGMGTLRLDRAFAKNGISTSARGDLLVFFDEGAIPRLKEFGRGSIIFAEGNFFSAKDGTLMFRAKGTHITKPAPRLEQFRTKCRHALIRAFSEQKWGGLSLALLVGIRDNLDTVLAKQYADAGCSYILALSGMHLAIVSALISFLLIKPLGKKRAAVCGAIIIVVYVYFVGSQPSLMRSMIMYLLGTAAVLGAFNTNAGLLLALSFLIQINIESASGDAISFLLSYGALAGILTLGESFLFFLKGKLPDIIASPLAASLGAFFSTLSLCIIFFGTLRPVGIVAGLLIAPITTVFMICSIAYLIFSFVFPYINYILGFALNIMYIMLEKIASVSAAFPALPTKKDDPIAITVSILLPIAIIILHRYYKQKRLLVLQG
ncbi:MAG: ComEC/Rec2 family competence protein [Termitinemataceae bacterium]|nr:MAG: ComEC/Rec2 family competence protein [Termitinemataceae bacterium]